MRTLISVDATVPSGTPFVELEPLGRRLSGRPRCLSILDSEERTHVPITAFNGVTDGLDPNRRNRDHFVVNTNLDEHGPWVPYADGVWLQPCCFNVTSGGFSVVLKALPGAQLGVHYHIGTVRGYTIRGHWRYLEHDWVAGPGTFIYEPAGEAHTLVITKDSPEPA